VASKSNMTPAPPAIRLDGVSKSFAEAGGTREVLREISLVVAPGELVALVGRSGSGKSTLLNLVAALDRPSAGTIAVGGQDLGTLDDRGRTLFRRRQVGFVFQFFNLLPTLTVEENVLLPLELIGQRARGHEARSRAAALLAKVGLQDRAASYPDRLSGGEQQRIAVARALVHDPALVLADEPTGALDAETGRGVLQMLTALGREQGKAVLLVTHSDAIAHAADRVLVLESGRLAAGPGRA
jgi:putative ABC transport system ATP-binding protein